MHNNNNNMWLSASILSKSTWVNWLPDLHQPSNMPQGQSTSSTLLHRLFAYTKLPQVPTDHLHPSHLRSTFTVGATQSRILNTPLCAVIVWFPLYMSKPSQYCAICSLFMHNFKKMLMKDQHQKSIKEYQLIWRSCCNSFYEHNEQSTAVTFTKATATTPTVSLLLNASRDIISASTTIYNMQAEPKKWDKFASSYCYNHSSIMAAMLLHRKYKIIRCCSALCRLIFNFLHLNMNK